MSILWTILIGFIAGVIAKFVVPGDKHEPQGYPHHHLRDRRSLRRNLPRPGSRLVSSRRRSRTDWRDRGRYPHSISLGLHRVEASNALARLGRP